MGALCEKRVSNTSQKTFGGEEIELFRKFLSRLSYMEQRVNRFEIIRELGGGAMGRVYLAVDSLESTKKFAIKALQRERLGERGVFLLQREFQLLRSLGHNGLARAIDLIVEPTKGDIFLVQEFVEGEDFSKASRGVSPQIIMEWGASIAVTLSYLHSRNVVHGDLKPQNVIVSSKGPVLVDLGVCAVIKEGGVGLSGTPVYLAPEVLRGAPFTPRSDIYSLGVMLYEAIAGCLPYDAPDLQGLFIKHLTMEAVSLRELLPALDTSFADIIKKMICKDPTLRYQSASTVAKDITKALGEAGELDFFLPTFPPFVGRTKELELIKNWIDGQDGGGAVIHGPVGSGTSRLLREASDYARIKGLRVFEFRVNRQSGVEDFIKIFGDSALTSIVKSADIELGKYKIWDAVSDRIEELHKKTPLLLCFDDFELASPFFEEMVRYLVARFSGERKPKIISAEAGEKKPIKWNLEIKLAPLNCQEISAFVEDFRGWKLDDRESAKLAQLCGGSPLYLVEIARNARSAEELLNEALPSTLEAMLRFSLGRLNASELRLMEAVAVWGAPVTEEVLEKMLAEKGERLSQWLGELVQLGFLRRGEEGYEITMPVLRRIVEESIANAQTRRLHAIAGQILLAQENVAPVRIARHLLLGGEMELGAQWALKAGEQLVAVGANKEASEICKIALDKVHDAHVLRDDLLELMGKTSSEAGLFDDALKAFRERIEREEAGKNDALVLARLHLEMARCQQRKGEYERAERAVKRAEESLKKVSAKDEREKERFGQLFLETRERKALIQLARGEYHKADEIAQQAINELGSAQAVPLLIVKGLAETYGGRLNQAVDTFHSAISILARTNDPKRLLLTHSSLGVAFQHQGALNEALEQYQKALEFAEKSGDLKSQTAMAMNIATLKHQMEDYGEAMRMYSRALNLAQRLGSLADEVRIQSNYAGLLLYLGDVVRARELVDSSLVNSKFLGLKQIEGYCYLLRGDILKARGEMISARKEYLSARRILSSIGSAREAIQTDCRLALLYSEMGEWERAISSAKSVIEHSHRLNMAELEAQGWLILAKTAGSRGLWEDALRDIRQADAIANRARTTNALMWEIKAMLGHALMKNGMVAEAKEELQRAYEIVITMRDKLPEEFRDSFLLGRAWETLKDNLERVSSASQQGVGEKWEKLLEINRQLNMEHNLNRLLELIMDSVLVLVQAERGFLILERDGKLEIPVARNIDKETIKGAKGKISRSIAEEVIRTNKPVMTVDALKDQRFDKYASVHELKLRSVLCIPLRVKERVVGSLYVDNRFQVGAFKPEDLKVMEAFADQSAIALENARLIAENELKRRMLENSNAKIRKLVEELERKVDMQSLEIENLHKELESGRELKTKYDYPHIVGRSSRMKEVFSLMDKVTDSNVPVLIEGESGTGKELVARAIHFNGPRKDKRFLSENCSAIPDTLLESELFGHEKGAFTGAVERKIGIFEAANGGTIFLDEIGDMSLNMQAKLLRVLQDGEVRRVGSEKAIYVDVRVISATHRRLEDLIKNGLFREDLYWRLNVVKISMPPLRDKREDIPLLVNYFVEKLSYEMGTPVKVSPEVMRVFMAYDWPGNVRELENELRKSALLSGGTIRITDLTPRLLEATRVYSSPAYRREEIVVGEPLAEALDKFEREYIERTLKECGGNKVKAAKMLGIGRRTLYDKLAKYGLDKNGF